MQFQVEPLIEKYILTKKSLLMLEKTYILLNGLGSSFADFSFLTIELEV